MQRGREAVDGGLTEVVEMDMDFGKDRMRFLLFCLLAMGSSEVGGIPFGQSITARGRMLDVATAEFSVSGAF